MLTLTVAGLLLDPDALSKLLQLPLAERVPERAKTQTRLPLKLHGTLIGDDCALALVSDPVRTLVVGSTVGDARVVAITRDCVTFDDDTELCRKPREPSAAARAPSSPGVHVKLTDFAQWTQVRITPAPGGGFKLQGIVPGSIYEKLGIQNGDILRKVNGSPVDFSTARLVQPGQQLTVELERAGSSYVLSGQLD